MPPEICLFQVCLHRTYLSYCPIFFLSRSLVESRWGRASRLPLQTCWNMLILFWEIHVGKCSKLFLSTVFPYIDFYTAVPTPHSCITTIWSLCCLNVKTSPIHSYVWKIHSNVNSTWKIMKSPAFGASVEKVNTAERQRARLWCYSLFTVFSDCGHSTPSCFTFLLQSLPDFHFFFYLKILFSENFIQYYIYIILNP